MYKIFKKLNLKCQVLLLTFFYLATAISASVYLPILQYENYFTAAAVCYVFIVY